MGYPRHKIQTGLDIAEFLGLIYKITFNGITVFTSNNSSPYFNENISTSEKRNYIIDKLIFTKDLSECIEITYDIMI